MLQFGAARIIEHGRTRTHQTRWQGLCEIDWPFSTHQAVAMDFLDVQRVTYPDLAGAYEEFGSLYTRKCVARHTPGAIVRLAPFAACAGAVSTYLCLSGCIRTKYTPHQCVVAL